MNRVILRFVGPDIGPPLTAKGARASRNGLTAATQVMEGEVARRVPVGATGQHRGSVASRVRGSFPSGLRGEVFSPLRSMEWVEEGRGAGRMPPEGPIRLWVSRKLGTTDPSVVFLVRRKIGRAGTKGAHAFRDAVKFGSGLALAAFEAAFRRSWK